MVLLAYLVCVIFSLQMQVIAKILIFVSYHNHSGDLHVCLHGCSAYFCSASQSNWSCKLYVAFTAAIWRLFSHHNVCQNALLDILSSLIGFLFLLVLVVPCNCDFLLVFCVYSYLYTTLSNLYGTGFLIFFHKWVPSFI